MRVRRALARLVRAGRPRSQGRKPNPVSHFMREGRDEGVAGVPPASCASEHAIVSPLVIPAFARMTGVEGENGSAKAGNGAELGNGAEEAGNGAET